jgi:hypothetical protein
MNTDLFNTYVAPFASSLPELCVALLGFFAALAAFVPPNSKLGRLLNRITGSIVKLKDFVLKRKLK